MTRVEVASAAVLGRALSLRGPTGPGSCHGTIQASLAWPNYHGQGAIASVSAGLSRHVGARIAWLGMALGVAPVTFDVTPMNLDTALRYRAVIDLLDYRPDMSIVEVGSGSGGITEFLDHPVTGVDKAFDRTAERRGDRLTPVIGSAESLPFADGEFDAGVSVEMLEHIEPQHREAAIRELVRVVRPGGRVIMTFPADALGKELDSWLNGLFRKRTGAEHPWVSEHLENGHPRTKEMAAAAGEIVGRGGKVAIYKHLAPKQFRLVHGLYTVHRGHPVTKVLGLYTNLAVRGIFNLVSKRTPSDGYRTILVIDKV
jgi:SAM-dependent methyltransferase